MKIVFIGSFNFEQVQEVNDFLKQQQTTDRVHESCVIESSQDNGNYIFKVVVKKRTDWIEKIIVRLVK